MDLCSWFKWYDGLTKKNVKFNLDVFSFPSNVEKLYVNIYMHLVFVNSLQLMNTSLNTLIDNW